MRTLKQASLIFLAASLAAIASGVFHPAKPAWYEVQDSAGLRWRISVDQAKKLVEAGEVVWIDARVRAKFEQGHLPGAILLNTEEWADLMFTNQEALQAVLDRPVIVYCDGSGCARSDEIAVRLRELMGLDPVYVLDGSWQDLKSGQ